MADMSHMQHDNHSGADDIMNIPTANADISTDHSQHHHAAQHSADNSGHSMSFHFSNNEIVLFSFWHIESVVGTSRKLKNDINRLF